MITVSETRELSREDRELIARWPGLLPGTVRELVLVGRLQRALVAQGHSIIADGWFGIAEDQALATVGSICFGPELTAIIARYREKVTR